MMKGTIDISKLRTPEVKKAERADSARAKRDVLLSQFDTELYRNPLYWGELSPEQRNERSEYRKALKDLTKQAGFPDVILWPELPT